MFDSCPPIQTTPLDKRRAQGKEIKRVKIKRKPLQAGDGKIGISMLVEEGGNG